MDIPLFIGKIPWFIVIKPTNWMIQLTGSKIRTKFICGLPSRICRQLPGRQRYNTIAVWAGFDPSFSVGLIGYQCDDQAFHFSRKRRIYNNRMRRIFRRRGSVLDYTSDWVHYVFTSRQGASRIWYLHKRSSSSLTSGEWECWNAVFHLRGKHVISALNRTIS